MGAGATSACRWYDHWWQTETGWAIAANPAGNRGPLPVKLGSPSVADARATTCTSSTKDGHEVAAGEMGAIAIKLPLPPGTLPTLWNAERALHEILPEPLPRLLRDR